MSAPLGFALRLPEPWTDYDLSGRGLRDAHVRARSAVSSPAQRAAVDDAYRQAGELLRASVRQGALSMSGLVEQHEEGMLIAFLAVFGVAVPDETSGDAQALLGAMRRGDGGRGRRMSTVTLHHGVTGARVTAVEQVRVSDDADARMFTMTTVVPVPGGDGRHLVVSAVSPNLEQAALLEELFDVLTGTLRFVTPLDDDDTDLVRDVAPRKPQQA